MKLVSTSDLNAMIGAGSSEAPQRTSGVSDTLLDAVMQKESGGDPNAVSPKGAIGPYQIMPDTARDPGYGVQPIPMESLRDPEISRRFASDLLSAYTEKFGGDVEKGLAAYNAGPKTVEAALEKGGDWRSHLPAETRDYIETLAPVAGGKPQGPQTVSTKQLSQMMGLQRPEPESGAFMRGVKSGWSGLKGIGTGAIAAAADGLGIEDVQSWAIDLTKQYQADAAAKWGETPTLEQVFESEEWFEDFSSWVGANMGQGMVTTVPALVASVINPMLGVGVMYSMGVGEVYGEQLGESEDPNAGIAAAAGVPYAIAERLFGAGAHLARLARGGAKSGAKTMAGRIARKVPETMAGEATAEFTQEGIQIGAAGIEGGRSLKETYDREALARMAEAGAAGAVAGAPFGVVGGAIARTEDTQPAPAPESELEPTGQPQVAETIEDAPGMEEPTVTMPGGGGVGATFQQPARADGTVTTAQLNEILQRQFTAQDASLPGRRIRTPGSPGTRAKAGPAFKVQRAAEETNPAPTEGQKAAGNYKKGRVNVQGIPIAIETPAGGERSGTDPDGNAWSVRMPAHYGYVERTEGKDGDQVDVFVGPSPESDRVFVIDQLDARTGQFDEHKAVLGVQSQEEAEDLYRASYSDDAGQRIGGVTEMSAPEFAAWARSGDTKSPLAWEPPKPARKQRAPRRQPNQSLAEFIAARGGIVDDTGDLKAMNAEMWHRERPGRDRLVREPGRGRGTEADSQYFTLDRAREAAEEAGYLPAGSDTNDLLQALDEDLRGNRQVADSDLGQVDVAAETRRIEAENRNAMEREADDLGLDYDHTTKDSDLGARIVEARGQQALKDRDADIAAQLAEQTEDEVDRIVREVLASESEDVTDAVAQDPDIIPFFGDPEPAAAESPQEDAGQAGPVERGQGEAGRGDQAAEAGGEAEPAGGPQSERTEQGEQVLAPGVQPVTDREKAEAKGRKKLTGKGPQKAPDDGLFDTGARRQTDLLDQTPEPPRRVTYTVETGEVTPNMRTGQFEGSEPERRTETISEHRPDADAVGAMDAAAKAADTPALDVSRKITRELGAGRGVTWKKLQGFAEEAYGGTLAEGAWTWKDAYDAMELGVVRYLRSQGWAHPKQDAATAKVTVDRITKEVSDKLPSQTRRSAESDSFQQFSTPPEYAFLANWLANYQQGDSALEPSAGTGLIAGFMRKGASPVWVNELSDRRADLLEQAVGLKPTREDAEQLHNILPKDVRPSVVVMNPPFSETGGRVAKKQILTGARHVAQALNRLEEGGRLVAIVGRGMSMEAPTFRDWWDRISDKYTVRANVEVPGKVYKKYGTTFATRVLVIDKTGPTEGEPVTGSVESLDGLIDLLQEVRNDRTAPSQRRAAEPARESDAETGGREAGPGRAVRDTTDASRAGQGAGRSAPRTEGADQQPSRPADGDGASEGASVADPDGAAASPAGQPGERSGGAAERGASQAAGEPAPVSDTVETERVDPDPAATHDLSDSLYEDYRPQRVQIKGAKPHPGPLVQSAAMASVEPPTPAYQPKLQKPIISQGKLSTAQLEAITYAGEAHSEMLPAAEGETAYRRGFFIGDGTGVGKGREISGIILDNLNQGRKKAVWFSANARLLDDAKRDFEGIGGNKERIFPLSNVKADAAIERDDGILFTTYSTLASASKPKNQGEEGKTRLQQIVDWLGADFDGVIAFDEAHYMGNAVAMKGKRGLKKPSQRALAGVELQKLLPNARVVYVSATGATEVSNLGYAERLGLWGKGTPFATKEQFINEVTQGGIAAMELIARDLKAMGLYIARNLSYDGVSYDRIEHQLSPRQAEIYDKLATAWQGVLHNIHTAMEAANSDKNPRARSAAMSFFWGAHQRFFNQILTSMQMPSVIDAIERDVKNGDAVVLQLVNTNEAQQERQAAQVQDEADLEGLDLTPKQTLLDFVDRSFPTVQYEEYTDEDGNLRTRPVKDRDGNLVQNAAAVAIKEQLLDELSGMKIVPEGPLELLLNHFGSDKVAEITGRKRRFVRDLQSGRVKEEKRTAKANAAEADAFMGDKKQILVFSDAGGTGRSYHAALDAANQRKRQHYLLQPGWRADNAVQGFGRSHRSNQKQPPRYRLVHTDLKGHKRFISSVARRLDQLGALTKGQRQAGSQGLFSEKDNLESPYAADALERFYTDLHRGRVEGMTIQEFQDETGLNLIDEETGQLKRDLPEIPQFLNRILSMTIARQNLTFDAFYSRLEHNIERAVAEGTLDVGLETLRADTIAKTHEETVYTDERSGAETKYVALEVGNKANPRSFDDLMGGSGLLGQKIEQFVKSQYGNVYAVTEGSTKTTSDGDVIEQARLTSPLDVRYIDKVKLRNPRAWTVIEGAEAQRQAWEEQVARVPEYIKRQEHLITGVILPIWDRLKGEPRVYRVQTDQGERMIGRKIPDEDLREVLRNLGATGDTPNLSPQQAVDAVLQGKVLQLANGWLVKRSRVSNEWRIEVMGVDYPQRADLERDGAFAERIQWQMRYFLPTGDTAAKVMEAVTKYRPIVGLQEPGGEPMYAIAHHASPHRFDRFSTEHIGTGEGAQAYGWGLYFAGSEDVRDHYYEQFRRRGGVSLRYGDQTLHKWPDLKQHIREQTGDQILANHIVTALEEHGQQTDYNVVEALRRHLADRLVSTRRNYEHMPAVVEFEQQKVQEHLARAAELPIQVEQAQAARYTVNLAPAEDDFLLWDKPLSEQSEKVREALRNSRYAALRDLMAFDTRDMTGQEAYKALRTNLYTYDQDKGVERRPGLTQATDRAISLALNESGIPGIKYLDGISRRQGEGNYNYVIFDADHVQVIERYARARRPGPEPQRKQDPERARTEAAIRASIHKTLRTIAPGVNVRLVNRILPASAGAFERSGGREGDTIAGEYIDGVIRLALNAFDDPKQAAQYAGHEAIHFLREAGLFTAAEWQVLSQRSRDQWIGEFGLPDRPSDPRVVEEGIAYAYQHWTPGKYGGPISRIMRKIQAFLGRLRNALRGLGYQTADDVFGRVARGDVGRRQATGMSYRGFLMNSVAQVGEPKNAIIGAANPRVRDLTFGDRLWDAVWDSKVGRFYDTLHTLPAKKRYLMKRYRTLGKIGEVERVVGDLSKPFDGASQAVKDQAYAYLTGEGALDAIEDPKVRDAAAVARQRIDEVGAQLVEAGLLNEDTYLENRGTYLPRAYLKHLHTGSGFGGGKPKPSDMGYLKARKDIPEEVRMLILGQITDPGFLSAKGFGQPARDLAIMDFLNEIARDGAWVAPRSLVNFRGNLVTPLWLKAEAEAIRNERAPYMPEGQRNAALEMAQTMESAAQRVLGDADLIPSEFKQIPDTRRYGRLRGMYVHKEIYEDIIGSANLVADPTGSLAEQLYGAAAKATGLWKLSKVALNPPTQVRNFVSNAILLNLSGTPIHRIPSLMIRAIREMQTGGKYYQIAQRYGVTQASFAQNELYRVRSDLLRLRKEQGGVLPFLLHAGGRVAEFASDTYQLSESIYKTARIIDAMERQKMGEAEAAIAAHDALFDYSLVPRSVDFLRRMPFGAPFITFQYKALPKVIEAAVKRPWVFAPYMAIPAIMTAMIMGEYDVEHEDVESLRMALPEWLRKRGNAFILPYKDAEGRWQAMDVGYFFPWSAAWGAGKAAATGDVKEFMTTTGIGGAPVAQVLAAIQTNIDPFTEQPVVNEFDPPAKQVADIMNYAWRMSAPSFITDQGAAWHTYKALTGHVDPRSGRPKYTVGQSLARFGGVNTYPVDPVFQRNQNIRWMRYEMDMTKRRMRKRLRDQNLTPDQRRKIAEEYLAMMKEQAADIREYAQESEVPPALQ